ncbi:hypothetical protein CAEBREN_17815 [Caenorhabditis brenneri]|uniref:Uncharacterized protein n=1 Tax=Caenorhabditis brenneri TaxID=135651 RepID=G0NUC0_CAEBE|nr:hypothetical protein CAEBREN_17815 [Caenorhabditis brenneri]
MSNKSLSYESLKTVLKHIKPNKRVQLASQIPSIRKVERIVPIHYNQLIFNDWSTTVDDTKYQLGVYQEYHNEEETPLSVQKHNSEGGYQQDIDEDGQFKRFDKAVPSEGDLVLWENDASEDETVWNDDWEKETKQDLEEMRASYPNPKGLIPYMMDKRKVALELYHRKKNGLPLPFTQHIRLTITSPEGVRIERINYEGKKLHEASKYLNSVLFGNRKQLMFTNFFAIPAYDAKLYLPAGFKIRVNHLQLNVEIMDKLKESGIISESSFPLNKLTMIANTDQAPLLLEHNFSKNAETLVIANTPFHGESWATVLENFENKHIIVKHSRRNHNDTDYLLIIRIWLQDGRPLGTKFSFGVMQISLVFTFLGLVRREFGATEIADRTLSIDMNNQTTKLIIYHEQAEPEIGDKLMLFVCGYEAKWFVRMKVVAASEV